MAEPAQSDNNPKPWTEADDRFLIFYGHCLNLAFGGAPKGYEFVARQDLHRPPAEAVARAEQLRREQPDMVKALEWEAEQDPPDEAPRRRRKKEAH